MYCIGQKVLTAKSAVLFRAKRRSIYSWTTVALSLAGPPLHSEEGSGVMPISDLFCCSEECSTNQIVTRNDIM